MFRRGAMTEGHSKPRELPPARALEAKMHLLVVLRPSIALVLAGSQGPKLGRGLKKRSRIGMDAWDHRLWER